jgi:hypothetical protein
MIVYRLSDEAISELRYAVDEDTNSWGEVRIAIDDGLKVKIREGAWSPPLAVTVEGSPDDDELPVQDLRALLDYNWPSEARDYQENPDDRHIFLSMKRLYDWLDSR